MASPPDQIAEEPEEAQSRSWQSALGRVAVLLLILLLGLVVLGWIQREQIARDLIGEQLEELGIPATYESIDISPEQQIINKLVIGDPKNPDMTAEQVKVRLIYGFGIPEIGRITVVKPRLYGSYLDGKLSFGSLDTALFPEDQEDSTGLPEVDLKIEDGRALLLTDYGPIGAKLDGEGMLNDGFGGTLAAIAPNVAASGCSLKDASAYGAFSIDNSALKLDGPLRVSNLTCPQMDAAVEKLAWQSEVRISSDFAAVDIGGQLVSERVALSEISAAGLSGPLAIAFANGDLVSDLDLTLSTIRSDRLNAQSFAIDGALRTADSFAQIELDADIEGEGIGIGSDIPAQLRTLAASAKDSLAEPLLLKLASAVQGEIRNAGLNASVVGRIGESTQSLVVPDATLRSSAGSPLVSVTRAQYRRQGSRTPLISGNFRVAGRELPALVGRMESSGNNSVFRLKMQPYAAGTSSVALPEMLVSQSSSGAYTFTGSAVASGPLPGGAAQNLRVPIDGTWDANSGLALWRGCADVAFTSLAFANLELTNRAVKVCSARGQPILRLNGETLKVAAGLASLNVGGTLADTPIEIKSGPIGFAYPGIASAKRVEVSLGAGGQANRFVMSDFLANLEDGIAGSFDGAEVGLAAVPLDLKETSGEWSYTDGILTVENGQFTLSDRSEPDRFEPLPVSEGVLTLEDSVIVASGSVKSPTDGQEVSRVSLSHNLSSGLGFADLAVDGIRFNEGLQPTDLTALALGVVANVEGIVTGAGRIDWNAETVTSSGAFSSNSLDLAAAFGPVEGASGTVEFSDLLSLTTAPNQSIKVAMVNPGIEAKNGTIGFSLRDGQYLGVTGGEWPFMGGKLYLRPVDLNLGVQERRRYVLEVEAVDAALFVENLELANLAATGIFDGALPLVFDEQGFGQIEGGLLNARPPGGNVSYVGELTYEDLSPIANYAFQTLRSLDYERMRIEMDGPLTGDIVTRVKFNGVTQGEGTSQNFITRQIADLPIQFNVNIRAPFYKLVTTLKSIYDPSTVRDPRDLGLLTDDGTRFVTGDETLPSPPEQPELPSADSEAIRRDELPIQTLDSEEVP